MSQRDAKKKSYEKPCIQVYSAREILGQVAVATAVYGPQTSDRRYKSEIEDLKDAGKTVSALRGVSYEWRKDRLPGNGVPSGRDIGVIAQEVEAVLPALVHTDASGNKSVDYYKLVAVLIEAHKELEAEKNEMRKELNRLKAQFAEFAGTIALVR